VYLGCGVGRPRLCGGVADRACACAGPRRHPGTRPSHRRTGGTHGAYTSYTTGMHDGFRLYTGSVGRPRRYGGVPDRACICAKRHRRPGAWPSCRRTVGIHGVYALYTTGIRDGFWLCAAVVACFEEVAGTAAVAAAVCALGAGWGCGRPVLGLAVSTECGRYRSGMRSGSGRGNGGRFPASSLYTGCIRVVVIVCTPCLPRVSTVDFG
jgi:hypothetical protein